MDDLRTSAPYRYHVNCAGLDPALRQVVEIRIEGPNRRAITLRPGQNVDVDGVGSVNFLDAVATGADAQIPPGVRVARRWMEPEYPHYLAPVPRDAHEYRARFRSMIEWLSELGARVDLSGDAEFGWLPIVERLVSAVVATIDPDERVAFQIGTERKGLVLEIETAHTDQVTSAFRQDLVNWARAAADTLCPQCGRLRAARDAAHEPAAIQSIPQYMRPQEQRVSIAAPQGLATTRLVAVAGRVYEVAIATEDEVNALPADLGRVPPSGTRRLSHWRAIRLHDLEVLTTTLHLVGLLDGSGPWLSGALSTFTEYGLVSAGDAHLALGEERRPGSYEHELNQASRALMAAAADTARLRGKAGSE